MDNKSWYNSKTIWINIIAAVALFVESQYGYVIDPASQAVLLTMVNVLLRLVTRQPIT